MATPAAFHASEWGDTHCMDACSMVTRRGDGASVPTHLPAAPTALGCCHLLQGAIDYTSMFAGHDIMEVAAS